MKSVIIEPKENTEIVVTEDTQYIVSTSGLDKDKDYLVNLLFEKQGVSAEIIGLYKLYEDQALNLTTVATHKAPNTVCSTNIRGVLYDKSFSNYQGKIVIKKEAQQTNSYLDDSVLVVGSGTRNQSKPVLEIDADDVKASHGATTGRISEEHLYYLQTRGLAKAEAEEVIVEGFFEDILRTIVDDTIRMQIASTLKND